jgi:hypothetical protein
MDRLIEKLGPLIIGTCEQVLVASVLAFYLITFALLTIPESITCATSLGQLVWDQFSTPNPYLPAGNLTFRLIKTWTNHVVDVELARVRNLVRLLGGSSPTWSVALSRSALSTAAFPMFVAHIAVRFI